MGDTTNDDGNRIPIDQRIELAVRMNIFTYEEFWAYVREVSRNVRAPAYPLYRHELRRLLRVVVRKKDLPN